MFFFYYPQGFTDECEYCIGLMIIQCFACQSFHDETIIDPSKHITTSESTTEERPAVSEEVEAEAMDVGEQQVNVQTFSEKVTYSRRSSRSSDCT